MGYAIEVALLGRPVNLVSLGLLPRGPHWMRGRRRRRRLDAVTAAARFLEACTLLSVAEFRVHPITALSLRSFLVTCQAVPAATPERRW